MSDRTAPAGMQPNTPETSVQQRLDYIDHLRSAGRITQAGDLAGQLTPEGFALWMDIGEVIKAYESKKAPNAIAGKQEA